MKKVLLISSLFLLGSCKQEEKVKVENVSETSTIRNIVDLNYQEIRVVEIDSCEYIVVTSGAYDSGSSIIHKNNCKFCKK